MSSIERRIHSLILLLTTTASTRALINVATEKPAFQSSTLETNVASYAVDGDVSSCSITQRKQETAWWRVDLQTLYLVQSVHIKPRTSNHSSKLLAGYSISVSDGENETNYSLCYDYGTPDVLPDHSKEQKINCSSPLWGRYVKISQSREEFKQIPKSYSKYAILELCEITVFVNASQVARGKPASQSSKYTNFPAGNAADGSKGDKDMNNCSHTRGNEQEAWWRVDLGIIYLIQSILIYPRPRNVSESQGRFAGISLSVSKYKSDNYQVCFNYGKDKPLPDLTVKHVVNCNPPVPGRYVKISNSRRNPPYGLGYSNTAYVNLCEVEIIAEDCQSSCTDCTCNACKDGFYGVKCQHLCPMHCGENGSCNHRSGHCKSCKLGYYGADCTMTCSPKCVGNICSFDNGYCKHCNGSYYGPSCNISCPSRCASCKSLNGCTECDRNWYGSTCQKSCINCGNGLCDKLNGKCINKFCKVGYFTDYCNESCSANCKGGSSCLFSSGMCSACKDGYFGENCDKMCPPCGGKGSCHFVSGLCSSHSCRVGFYGNDRKCSKNCSTSCSGNGECSVIEGACLNGCKAGWKGPLCIKECDNNTFGDRCSMTCGKCKNNLCHHVYGTCLQGCQDGWSSFHCDIKDESSMTMVITGGVLGGLIIPGSIAIIYIIWRRRRRRTNDSTIYMSQCENSESTDNRYATRQTSNNQPTCHQRNETPTEQPRNTVNEGESHYEGCYEYQDVMENPNANGQQTQCVGGEENVYMPPREDPDSEDHMYTTLQSSNN